jgi:hypothetical protein
MGLKTLWKAIVLAALLLSSIVFTAYTISAYDVASHIHELFGRLMWSSIPGGSFFPWPTYPEIGLPALTPVNEVDVLFYQLFIKSWFLVGITVLLWTVTVAFCVILLFKNRKQRIMSKT